jgi:hypothetical protein
MPVSNRTRRVCHISRPDDFISPAQFSQKLINFNIKKFLVFPDHLISELQSYQPIVPLKFHTDILLRVMATNRADQTIPNFATADTLRVLVRISSSMR